MKKIGFLAKYKWQIASIVLTVVPFFLLMLQMYYGTFTPYFTASWMGRTYVLVNILALALGFAIQWHQDKAKMLKLAVINFSLVLGVIFIGGFGLNMLDTAGIDFGVEISNDFYILDAMTDTIVTTGIIINMIVKNIVPAVVVIIGIVMFVMADGPDEYITAAIECGVSIVMLLVLNFLV